MIIKYFWKSIIWAIIIFILCSIPGSDLPKFTFGDFLQIDKIAHIFMYFTFTIFLIDSFTKQNKYKKLKLNYKFFSILISIIYGGLIELFQFLWFNERSADLLDLLSNIFGIILGIFLFQFTTKTINKIFKFNVF